MSILPENKPHRPNSTPRNFFIYGKTMSGKSYLAERFPNPLFINTDGNSEMNQAPSIQVRNIKNSDGSLKSSIIEQLDDIVTALQTEKHSYETVVVDVIDDICVMLEQAICIEQDNAQSLSDIPYGKGYAMFNGMLQTFVMELKGLPLNVVYISRANTVGEGIKEHDVPSLKEKYYNIVNGNSDLVIYTQRIGKKYIRRVTDRRKHYVREEIKDQAILRILDNVNGVFDKPIQVSAKEQNKIIKQMESDK